MKRALAILSATLALATPAAADADDGPAPTGLRFGVRSGYAVPAGDAFNGSGALSDTVRGVIPLRLDLGVRVARHFYVGGSVQFGVVLPAACPAGMQCSGESTRFGLLGAFHLFPSALVDPWIGAGFGYEILSVARSTSSSGLDLTARGLELLDLEIGVDLRLTHRLRVGPVVSMSMGRFTSVELNRITTSDFNTVLHGWGMLGVRAAYDL